MSTPQPEPRLQFDPVAALEATDQADKDELQLLDDEVTKLGGRIVAKVRDVFKRATADNEQPVSQQIITARQARDELQAMLNAVTGGTNSGTTLTDDQRTLLGLLAAGDIRLIQVDDPDNPGTRVPAVRENRDRFRQRRTQSQSTTPAQPAPTNPQQPAPAASATGSSTSSGSTGTAPVAPAAPAAPATTPAQPAPTNPQQPAPAASATGSTQPAPAGGTGAPPPPPPANTTPPAKQGLLKRAVTFVQTH